MSSLAVIIQCSFGKLVIIVEANYRVSAVICWSLGNLKYIKVIPKL